MNGKTSAVIITVVSILVSFVSAVFLTSEGFDKKLSSTESFVFFWYMFGLVVFSAGIGWYAGRCPKKKQEAV